jgi:hypothetical protein
MSFMVIGFVEWKRISQSELASERGFRSFSCWPFALFPASVYDFKTEAFVH